MSEVCGVERFFFNNSKQLRRAWSSSSSNLNTSKLLFHLVIILHTTAALLSSTWENKQKWTWHQKSRSYVIYKDKKRLSFVQARPIGTKARLSLSISYLRLFPFIFIKIIIFARLCRPRWMIACAFIRNVCVSNSRLEEEEEFVREQVFHVFSPLVCLFLPPVCTYKQQKSE